MPVVLSNAEKGFLSWDNYMGLLGLEYISKFNFIIDYHRKKIYLKPNSSFFNPFKFPLSGIKLKEEGGGIICDGISKPSQAFDKGLREGHQLVSINGIGGRDIGFYQDLLQQEGEEVTIVVKKENDQILKVVVHLERLL